LDFRHRHPSDHPAGQLDSARHRASRNAGGSAIGGLLNVTFGNMAELILAADSRSV